MLDNPKNYYEVLGINPNATAEEIRRAYVQMARQYHPDRNTNAEKGHMAELNHVYEILSNPQKRQEYDTRFVPEKVYDFSKPKAGEKKVPVRQPREYKIGEKSFAARYWKEGLAIVIIIAMVYAMAYLVVKMAGAYINLPDWVHIILPT